jgi:orotidine-5'-phosphate decarboxylase
MDARTFFDLDDVDAVTIAPGMGEDSVTPFLGRQDKWVILLALTSNRGATDFQTILSNDAQPLYETVIRKSQEWATDENMMYVVGATRGEMFKDIRRIAPSHFLLVPGIGAQGGTLDDVCRYGMNADCGLIVNSSRGIIYASNSHDFAQAAAAKAREIQQEMARALSQR